MTATVMTIVALGLSLAGQGRPDPRIICPGGSSNVELPGPTGGKVLRCVDDSTGQPNGQEVWIGRAGYFTQRGRWDQGQRHGLWERWYPSGHLLSRITFNKGVAIDSRCLTEEKRKDVACEAGHQPVDWTAPGSAPMAPAAAGVAPAPAPAPQSTTPEIVTMPPLPPDNGGQ
jgi:hypothetical protein